MFDHFYSTFNPFDGNTVHGNLFDASLKRVTFNLRPQSTVILDLLLSIDDVLQ